MTSGNPPSIQYDDHEIPPDSNQSYSAFAEPSNRRMHTSQQDLYADLSTFTFGAPNFNTSHLRPRNSLSDNDEIVGALSDTTPRPSLSIYGPNDDYPRASYNYNRADDAASTHTFGAEAGLFAHSSASASVSSFVSDGRGDYDGTSSVAGTMTQFSSDEYEEDDSMDETAEHDPPSLSPNYHAHGVGWDPLTNSSPSSSNNLYGQRRPSLPMTIPGATPPNISSINETFYNAGRDREDSIATVRRPSRSLDDDMQMFNATHPRMGTGIVGSPGVGQSQPLSKGDWETLGNKGKARERSQSILVPTSSDAPSATHGFDADWMKEIQGGITSMAFGDVAGFDSSVRRASATSTGRRPSNQSWTQGWGAGNLWGRRQSTATIGTLDDPFARQVYRWDNMYGQRRGEWSFKKEKAESGTAIRAGRNSLSTVNSSIITNPISSRGSISTDLQSVSTRDTERTIKPKPSPHLGMPRGTEEVWRCEFVGRYKVHRREVRSKAPSNVSKPPQQRLDIQPFADPYAKVDAPHGTPVTIHKHSRAIAFSIYRQRMKLPSSRRPASAAAQRSVAPTRSSIMLAPKRVQEQYTNTHTTITLDTHGLLGNESSRIKAGEKQRDKYNEKYSSERHSKQEKKGKEKKTREEDAVLAMLGGGRKEKDKDKKKRTGRSSTSQTSSASSATGSIDGPTISAPNSQRPHPSDPLYLRNQPSSRSLSSTRSLRANQSRSPPLPAPPPSAPVYTPAVRAPSVRRIREPDADDDEDLPTLTRTPHSEAFGAMDPNFIVEQMRHRTEHQRPAEDSPTSFLKRLTRPLRSSGTPSTAIDGGYIAPWRMLAPRSQQEENERVVQILNDSFKGVGLLPSKPASKSRVASRRKSTTGGKTKVDIFEQVPADSLYMLLPLWPGETDPQSSMENPSANKPKIPPEQRQYLLVYYAPFDTNPKDSSKPRKEPDKRTRSSQTLGFDEVADEYSVLLTSFHCSARLVGYGDLHGSGVLAPNEGLFVTGPISEAMAHLPSPSIREEHQTDFVIGICHSRENGIEFIPEGLVKMGLCYPTPVPLAEEPATIPDEDETPEEPELKLTPIGRAVLEMAWLGCIALTSFGTT